MKLPTILILNGLLQYQTTLPIPLPTPTKLLANDLRAIGFRVVEDTHFAFSSNDEEPVIIMGHSRGGGAALRFAARLKREAKFEPLVITFDAVPAYPCPTRCINFQSPEYKLLPVPGAKNIDANIALSFVPVVGHSYLPSSPHVRARVKAFAAPLANPMR